MIIKYLKRKPKDKKSLQTWFAWYPVRVNKNEVVWLEKVLRAAIPKTYVTMDDWTRYKYTKK